MKISNLNNCFSFFGSVFFLLSALLLFLSPTPNVFGQDSRENTVQAWIQEQRAKLPADLQVIFSPDSKKQKTPYYEHWAQTPSLAELHQKGVPRSYKGKKGAAPAKLENAYRFVLEGYSLVIAEYAGNISELYFKTKSGYKLLFHFGPCNKIRPIKPGKKAPVLILIHVSGCGSGWNETIYRLDKNGFLKEAGHLGGQQAHTRYVDIDNDGILEIVNTSASKHYPPELESRLKVLKDYQEPVAPVLSQNTVFKWNGEKFAKIAEFDGQVEW